MLAALDCSLWAHIDKNVSFSRYFTVASPNIDRNVVARRQPICSCSIIDVVGHSLPPFLAFVLSLNAHAGVSGSRYRADYAAVWRRVAERLHGPATHTLFHLKHSQRFLDTELTQRAASLSIRTHCTAVVTRPKATDQLSGLSHTADSHCAEQPFQMSSYKSMQLLRVSVNIQGRRRDIWLNKWKKKTDLLTHCNLPGIKAFVHWLCSNWVQQKYLVCCCPCIGLQFYLSVNGPNGYSSAELTLNKTLR